MINSLASLLTGHGEHDVQSMKDLLMLFVVRNMSKTTS
jgi:hypothetical protein